MRANKILLNTVWSVFGNSTQNIKKYKNFYKKKKLNILDESNENILQINLLIFAVAAISETKISLPQTFYALIQSIYKINDFRSNNKFKSILLDSFSYNISPVWSMVVNFDRFLTLPRFRFSYKIYDYHFHPQFFFFLLL